jgi:hypothetical protein
VTIRVALLTLAVTAALTALTAEPARAGGVNSMLSECPSFIRLVGSQAGVPDSAAGRFQVIARDTGRNPMGGIRVWIDFSACGDIVLTSDPLDPRLEVDCASHTIRATTDAAGVATFTLLGHSLAAASAGGTALVIADGIPVGFPRVAVFDLDGRSGVDAGDLSVWLGDLGKHDGRARADYDGDGQVTAVDLALLLAEIGTHRSSVTAPGCP